MTSFDRQNAHFNDSRLYRQSAELSTGLLASNLNNDPLRELCHIALHGVSGLTINEPRQFERTIRNLHAHLVRLARGSSAYQFIPAIHEAVGEFYRTDEAGDLQWVGGALKLAAGSLWTEMMASRSVGARSEQALTDLVVAAGALDQALIAKVYLYLTMGEGRLTLDHNGLSWNEAFARVRIRAWRAFHRRGKIQRFSALLSEAVFDPDGSLARLALLRLSGSTEGVSGRPEALFEVLCRVTDQMFWAGLWARITLALLAVEVRGAVASEKILEGIAVIHQTEVQSLFGDDATNAVQKEIVKLFWQTRWREGLDLYAMRHGFVQRPAMRIDRMREVFVTSAVNVLDSLTMFFEEAAYNLHTDRRLGPRESVYRLLFSGPFELSIAEQLRSRGFKAGRVSETGRWAIQEEGIDLGRSSAGPPPGEIDVLATTDDGRAIVVECKCLKLPDSESRFRTIAESLGEDDISGYIDKLSRKAKWFGGTDLGRDMRVILPVLVTDMPLNFRSWQIGEVVITDDELLPTLVDSLLKD